MSRHQDALKRCSVPSVGCSRTSAAKCSSGKHVWCVACKASSIASMWPMVKSHHGTGDFIKSSATDVRRLLGIMFVPVGSPARPAICVGFKTGERWCLVVDIPVHPSLLAASWTFKESPARFLQLGLFEPRRCALIKARPLDHTWMVA